MLCILFFLQPYIELSVETSNGKHFLCILIPRLFLQLSGNEGRQGVICQCLGFVSVNHCRDCEVEHFACINICTCEFILHKNLLMCGSKCVEYGNSHFYAVFYLSMAVLLLYVVNLSVEE